MARRIAGLGVLALALVAGLALWVFATGRTCACSPTLSTLVSPADGVVIAVDAASLTDIRGFTLRISGGPQYDFKLGALENATQFSPSHLKEHMATSIPIRVWFRVENGDHVAYRLEDAPD